VSDPLVPEHVWSRMEAMRHACAVQRERRERHFLGRSSTRTTEHFDWLFDRPSERAVCAEDDARFDVDRRAAIARYFETP
jgi:hypothetical protein